MDRKNSFIQRFGRLYHQYIVDQYAKVESGRLNWHRFNQNNFRTELATGVQDAMGKMDVDARSIGKRVHLGTSFVGGPRNMMKLYQNAMSVVRVYGKPDLFITFTCNPNWPEITQELKANETPNDQPTLLARIFRLKLKEFLNDIIENKIFGAVVANIHVIEFQKR